MSKPRFSDKWRLLGAIMRDPDMTDAARRCAWAILDCYNIKTEKCFPGYELIARKAGVPLRTAKHAVNILIAESWFLKTKRGGRGHSNHYQPCFERVQRKTPFSDQETVQPATPFVDGKGCNLTSETVQDRAINGAKSGAETVQPVALESGNQQGSYQEHHQGRDDDGIDDARRLTQIFIHLRAELWPGARPVSPAKTQDAARDVLALANGDSDMADMTMRGCLQAMHRDGKPAPTSPLVCRHSLVNVMAIGRDAG